VRILTVRSRKDFLRVQRGTEMSARNGDMAILCKKTEEKYTQVTNSRRLTEFVRIGLVVTKKIDKRAVVRNRIKRRIRAITNIFLIYHCNLYINHVDYVIVLRRNVSDASHLLLLQSVQKLLGEIRAKYEQCQ
jgi:ribonuclease P protein component